VSGVRLNCKDLGRLLGVSRPTALAYLRQLEEVGLVARVPFYGGGKRPLLIAWEDPSPLAALLYALKDLFPGCGFYWWKHARTRIVDLVVDLGDERIGFSFTGSERPKRRDWQPLALAISRGVIHRGFLLHAGPRVFKRFDAPVFGVPVQLFMEQLGEWIVAWRAPTDSWQAMYRANRAVAGAARSRQGGAWRGRPAAPAAGVP